MAESMGGAPTAIVAGELALAGLARWEDALSRRPLHDQAAGAKYRFRAIAGSPKAVFSSWYELFPRSASPDPRRPGRLSDVIDRLSYVAELGFDVLYLPPIHPIGVTARKGKDNTSPAGPLDVGSPWAVGAAAGGHEDVAAELGTLADFASLVREAAARGIDVAMDLAFQCSPDHPWVTQHPDWFRHRGDGTIACAENPPKRYEDIYPLDFETRDRDGLWRALHHVTKTWADRGIKIFRVDNPHTKPFAFWEWLITEVKREHPETVFLSEAFTRPKVMHRLAKVGFDQSYTYFTWRYTKSELTEYFEELTGGPGRAYFCPNVWPNTPDILAVSLQQGGRAAFVARLILAGGLCANYGIYGPVFELMWDEPVVEGSEEYLHSEKYEIHHHDLDDPRSLRDVITKLNVTRRTHRALQRDANLFFLEVDNDQIIAWCKRDEVSSDLVIGVVSLDPQWVQSGFVELDPTALGLAAGSSVPVRDVLSDTTYLWQVGRNFVRLDPAVISAHLLVLERP
jgi:starch synthase (maltosyl-transferring)